MVDFFGFGLPDVKKEVMSMHHSHDEFGRLIPRVGDSMVTNLRRPIFTLLEDTGPGVHDTTVSACDQYLYQQQIGVVSCLKTAIEKIRDSFFVVSMRHYTFSPVKLCICSLFTRLLVILKTVRMR